MKNEYPVIGEAAWALMMRRADVTLASLTAELHQMACRETDAVRDSQIHEAQQWLLDYRSTEQADRRSDSPLKALSERADSVTVAGSGNSARRH